MYRKLLGWVAVLSAAFVTSPAFAQEAAASNQFDQNKWGLLAAALSISIAAYGGAISQGRAATTALEGIARNPNAAGKLFTPMILGLALIESLVIYAWIISFQIIGKVGGGA